jgi:hypothetical protein
MENKQRKVRVFDWEDDGDFLKIAYTQEDGQRVIGVFKRIGWSDPPHEVRQKIIKALNHGPDYIAGKLNHRSS